MSSPFFPAPVGYLVPVLTRILIFSISPGPAILTSLMDPDSYDNPDVAKLDRETELAKYDLFPMYPTCRSRFPTLLFQKNKPPDPGIFPLLSVLALLLGANVVLEIDGDTSDIQNHFHTSSTSGSASVGWGPFTVTSNFSHTDTQADSTCEATATGCKITIKSPQIIGIISEIVPALPRVVPKKTTT